jgi:uncharacterized FlaG/YvyC family protein
MADLGIARPQELLASFAGRLEAAPAVGRGPNLDSSQEGARRRPAEATPVATPVDEAVDIAALGEEIEHLNRTAKDYHLRFEVADSLGGITVRIVDEATGEVLRTIPPSAVLKLGDFLGTEAGQLIDAES